MAYKHHNLQKEKNLTSHNIQLNKEAENRKHLEESLNHIAFNFEYFAYGQNAGEDFKEWTHEQLIEMLKKMVEYSKKSKLEWLNQKNILSTYSDKNKCNFGFILPSNIPKENVVWARFRLESKIRLIGFFYKNSQNIFYVVFLDKEHRFYPTELK